MSETIVVPDNGNNNNGWNSPLGLLALGNNGYGYGNGGFLGGGFGAGILGGVLGGIFTNWLGGNGWGFGGGMNGNAAASLGAQATANNNLRMGHKDTGLTYTNAKERVSVIVLARTSSKAEFANTWFHELIHCSMHIARENGLSPDGEAVAYVGGELARSMQPIAARLMCPTCDG